VSGRGFYRLEKTPFDRWLLLGVGFPGQFLGFFIDGTPILICLDKFFALVLPLLSFKKPVVERVESS
jgi:hypothetical protein